MNARRRLLLALGTGLVAVAVWVVLARPPATLPRIGVIGERTESDAFVVAFRQALHELGYVEGKNVVVTFRTTNANLDRVPEIARELVALPVDVLVVGGGVSAQHAKAATTTIPIVFTTVGDPLAVGLVASLAHPGGNLTGMSNLQSELGAKQLELLKEVVPALRRVAVLHNPASPISPAVVHDVQQSARASGIALLLLEARRPDDVARVLDEIAPSRSEAILALSDPAIGAELVRIAETAAKLRLPSVYARREFAAAGGLIAYGPDFEDNYRLAARYVDKILKGAKPAELPVQQPTKLKLIVNRGIANAIGIAFPPSLLLRADEVIP